MVGIKMPDEERLPTGPMRDLVAALHELYRGAGRPGLRRIAKAIVGGDFPDTVSHETVSDMLNGKGVPRWSKLDCVVRQLAAWNVPRLDPEQTATRFLNLWEAVTGSAPGGSALSVPSSADVSSPPATGQSDAILTASHFLSPQEAEDLVAFVETMREGLPGRAASPQAPPRSPEENEWAESRIALIAGGPQWRDPISDWETNQIRHLRENQSSHPALTARSTSPDSPPSMRVGVRVACNPLPAMQPTSTAVRHNFLKFLSRQPMVQVTKGFTDIGPDMKWEKWGGHGRSNHEAILAGPDQRSAPVAWARLLLPEPQMPPGWRDTHSALFLLHVERHPWEPDNSSSAPPIPFHYWHAFFRKALDFPSVLATFLEDDLGLSIPQKHPGISLMSNGTLLHEAIASIMLRLTTPHAVTDLVDVSGYQHLPGSPVPAEFNAYAVTHSGGVEGTDMSIEWMRQMCDYVLHLDDYDSSLVTLRDDTNVQGFLDV